MKSTVKSPLPRITPEEAGIKSERVLAFMKAFEDRRLRLHSFMLQRGGRVFAEGYYAPYDKKQLQTIYSHSKSFTSFAIGLAVDDGVISLEDKVLSFFPEYEQGADDFQRAMAVRNLLTMSTGQFNEPQLFFTDRINPTVEGFFKTKVDELPGTTFRYNTPATYMLAAILHRKGIDLESFLQQRLFDKLGIQGMRWQRSSDGICTGGFGLSVVPECQALFGRLLALRGMWNGERIISEDYLDLATSLQINNGDFDVHNDWAQGYGFQFWCCVNNCFRADGMYGQLCVVSRDKDIVFTATSYCNNIQGLLNVFYEFILPYLDESEALLAGEGYAALQKKCGELKVQTPELTPMPKDVLDSLNGRTYEKVQGHPFFVPNKVSLEFSNEGLILKQSRGIIRIPLDGYSFSKRNRILPDTTLAVRCGMNGEGKAVIELSYLEMLQYYTFEIDRKSVV